MHKKNIILILFTILVDAFLIVVSFILGHYLKNGFVISPLAVIEQNSRLLVFATFTLLAFMQFFSLYSFEKVKTEIDEIGAIIGSLTFGMFFFEFMTIFYRDLIFKRYIIFWAWIISIVLIVILHIAIIYGIKCLLKKGIGSSNVLIIGTNEMAQMILRKIIDEPEKGMKVLGILDYDKNNIGKEYFGIRVLGEPSKIKDIIKDFNISKVIFAVFDAASAQMMRIIEECELLKVEFLYIPKLLDIVSSRVSTNDVAGFPLITVSEIQLYGANAFFKRVFDLFLGTIIFLLLSPLLLIVIVLIKLDSKGLVMYTQTRVGRNGKLFQMYKFRSMIEGAHDAAKELESFNEASGPIFKIKNDPRLTRVGKYLRRFSIDELPQIINVLIGDMSLVGPRPPLPQEVEKYDIWHKKRLRIVPGITGLWQVSGRSELPFDEMVRLDIFYIENWSLWLDIKILLKTIPAVLSAKGAY